MPKNPITIATAQSHISKDVKANGIEVRKLMEQASDQGARLINFPEGALSGYVKSQIMHWDEVDWVALQKELELIKSLAAELKLWVSLGCNHKLETPYRPYNSIYIISDTGDIHSRYDKQWCSNSETLDWYTPGEGLCIFEVDGWKFGCAICIEIQFPELFLLYGELDIDCLLYSVNAKYSMFGIQAQAHAATNNFWFSLSNAKEHSESLNSKMIGPSGVVQSQVDVGKSNLCISKLDCSNPEYDIALNYAKPWRKIARNGKFYEERKVKD